MILRRIWDDSENVKKTSKVLINENETETMALGYNKRKKGDAGIMDFHDDEEEFYIILKGRARLIIGDDEEEAGPGDVAYVPRNFKHTMICISEDDLEYLYVANWPGKAKKTKG